MVGTDIAQRSDMSSGGRSAVITSCICCIMAVLCVLTPNERSLISFVCKLTVGVVG